MVFLRAAGVVVIGALAGCGGSPPTDVAAVPETPAGDSSLTVVLATELGDIEIELATEEAPLSSAHFLAYVQGGHYQASKGASFYRVVRSEHARPEDNLESSIQVVQGGLLADQLGDPEAAPGQSQGAPPLPPVAHELTSTTGLRNLKGTIALARLEPGTANSEFFFNIRTTRR